MGALTRKAAIVGIREFPLRYAPDYTSAQIEAECEHRLAEGVLAEPRAA